MTRGRVLGLGGLFAAIVLAVVAFLSVFVVDPTHYALVLRFGQTVGEVREPGLYFKVPLVDNVVLIEKRLIGFAPSPQQLARDTDNEIVAGDQRRINVLAFGRYRVVDPLLFYQTVGTVGTANSRLLAILDASVRGVLSAANFQQIVAERRTELMAEITARVAAEAVNIGVQVVDVRIQRVDLPDQNANAIYTRMQTERQQEAAQIRAQGDEAARRIRALADRNAIVTVALANQDAEVTRGAGDAEVNRIFAEAYGRDPEFFAFYRSMQAYQLGLQPNTTTMLLSPNSDFFRFLTQFRAVAFTPATAVPPAAGFTVLPDIAPAAVAPVPTPEPAPVAAPAAATPEPAPVTAPVAITPAATPETPAPAPPAGP